MCCQLHKFINMKFSWNLLKQQHSSKIDCHNEMHEVSWLIKCHNFYQFFISFFFVKTFLRAFLRNKHKTQRKYDTKKNNQNVYLSTSSILSEREREGEKISLTFLCLPVDFYRTLKMQAQQCFHSENKLFSHEFHDDNVQSTKTERE